ncbi:PAS domain S-box protein [Indiicoccus explosivorum]|uniref:PAS domain S-box protein n=1 Tax=Indiicoccus explosivorum TaxID=1917864 RepID=UPI000B440817|nr:PAS domain S-box protein [Indiicoccus explosivorum]
MVGKPADSRIPSKEREEMYRQIVECSYETTIIHADHKVLYINEPGAAFLGAPKEEIIGANVIEIFPVSIRESIAKRIQRVAGENEVGELLEAVLFKADGTLADVELYCHPTTFGDRPAIQSIVRDVSERKAAEKRLRKSVIEVGTPVVPVSEGISVVPFVGDMDEMRIAHLLEMIPKQVQGKQLNYLILDFSGIYTIDDTVVDFMYKIDSTLKLLGVSPVCTGLRPEMAKKAVEACDGIASLRTMATVKQALSRLATEGQ